MFKNYKDKLDFQETLQNLCPFRCVLVSKNLLYYVSWMELFKSNAFPCPYYVWKTYYLPMDVISDWRNKLPEFVNELVDFRRKDKTDERTTTSI